MSYQSRTFTLAWNTLIALLRPNTKQKKIKGLPVTHGTHSDFIGGRLPRIRTNEYRQQSIIWHNLLQLTDHLLHLCRRDAALS